MDALSCSELGLNEISLFSSMITDLLVDFDFSTLALDTNMAPVNDLPELTSGLKDSGIYMHVYNQGT